MKGLLPKGKRFFGVLISMLLAANQIGFYPATVAYGADLGAADYESSYEDTVAEGQVAESDSNVGDGEAAESDSASAEESVNPEDISLSEGEDEDAQVQRGPPAETNEEVTREAVKGAAKATRAAKSGTVLTFTSDIHNTDSNTARNRLDSWLDKVVDMYGGIDAMGFCGDMGSASANESQFWTYTQSVMDVLTSENIPTVYTTGNHEFYNGKFDSTNNAVKGSFIVGAEGITGDNYRIYCLGTENWDNYRDNYTTGQITALSNYLNNVGNDKPIIILTHYPLHSFGSSRQTENADLVIDTLNSAANSGKKIVLLWGHNHSVSDTNYDEIFYPGNTIKYNSNNGSKTIDFYYGAAGCMSDSDYGSGSAYVKGKGLVITIDSADELGFAYYDANGNNVTENSSGGQGDQEQGGEESGQGVTPESGKKYVILASDGYALTSEGDAVGYTNGSGGNQQYNYNGLTGEQYTVGDNVAPDRLLWTFTASEDGTGYYIQSQDGKYLNGTYVSNSTGGYDGTLKLDDTPDIWTITGATSGNTVSAHILKSVNASQSDAGDKYLTHGNGSESVTNIFTLRSESNATSTVFYEYSDDGTYVDNGSDDPVPAGVTRYEETNSLEDGKEYIIAVTKDDGSVYAINNTGSPVTSATLNVTAASGDTPAYITTDDTGVVWKYTASDRYLINGGDYLYPSSSNGVMTYSSGRAIDYSGGKLSFATSNSGTYYITCGNGEFNTSKNESDAATIRLFAKTSGGSVTPVDPDDPTPTDGSVYKLVDSFTSGKEYLIVSANSAGSAYALTNPGGSSSGASMGRSAVTVQNGDADGDGTADTYISSDATDIVWTAAANGSGFNITNGSDYLEGKSGEVKVYSAQQYADRYWTYSDSQLKHAGGQNTYTVYYSNGFTSTYNNSTDKIYIYEKVDGSVTPVDPIDPTPTDGTVYKLVDSFTSGKEYLIVSANSAGSAYALTNPGGTSSGASMGRSAVTVQNGDADGDGTADTYISSDATDIVWTAAANGSGFNITNSSDYLEGKSGQVKIYSAQQYADRYWTYSDSQLKHVGGTNTYTVYYSNSSFTSSTSNSTNKIYIYEKVESGTHVHNWNDGDITKEATCTEAGVKTFTCTDCGETKTQEIPALGHDLKHHNEKAATCKAEGNIEYWTCERDGCGKYFSDADGKNEITQADTVIAKTDHTWNDGEVTKEATCTEAGVKTFTCTVCDETKTEEIPALGHDLKHNDAKDATCKEEGNIEYWSCERDGCGKYFSDADGKNEITQADTVIAKTAHTWNNGEVTKEPTCTETGVKTFTCTVCDETKTEEIPALGHDLKHNDAKDATCKEEGNIEYWTCERDGCGKYFSDADGKNEITQTDTVIAKTAHTWNNGEVTKEPTCTETGVKTFTCTVCDETKTEEIPALGHDLKQHDAKDATCKEEGNIEYWTCERDGCGKYFSDADGKNEITQADTVIAKTAHTWNNGKVTNDPTCTKAGVKTFTCTVCDATKTEAIPALGHDWKFQTMTWVENRSRYDVTADYVCKNDATHTQSVKADVSVTSTGATCTEAGITVHTATISKEAALDGVARVYTKEVKGVPLGHAYGAPTYKWAADYSTVTAKMVCSNDKTHVVTETVKTTKTVTEPTCEKDGQTTYTATFKNKAFVKQTKKVTTAKKKGHTWGAPSWTWTKDGTNGYKATLKLTCGNDSAHTTSKAAEVTAKTTAATCTTAGKTVYTAKVVFEGKTYTNTKTVTIAKKGHNWVKSNWTWTGTDAKGYTAASLKFTCKNDNTHTTVKKAAISTKVKAAKASKSGKIVYTAKVSFNGKDYSSSKTVKVAPVVLKSTVGKNSMTDTWNKIPQADGYHVYHSKCRVDLKLVKKVKAGTLTATMKKLDKAQYKTCVKAYKVINGKQVVISTSYQNHVTLKKGKNDNAKAVKVSSATTLKLKKGKTSAVKATVTTTKGKTLFFKGHCNKLRYSTADATVATVDQNGTITAVGAGTCKIFVIAPNGLNKAVTVTVK